MAEQLAKLWQEGWQGLLSLSAARPQGLVLCLFIQGPAGSFPAEVIPPPRVVEEPPVPPTGMRT